MLSVAICDDENLVCSQIESILLEFSKDKSLKINVEVFYSGEKLCTFLSEGNYFDLLFLDIELQTTNGVKVGKIIRNELKNESLHIIYISGKDSYAMELFDIRPLNFLIKPLQVYKVEEVVNRALLLVNMGNHIFEYKKGSCIYKTPIKDILYFESKGKKVTMYTSNETREFYHKLVDIIDLLGENDFILIHRSFYVNISHVIEYQYDNIKMINNIALPISQQHRKYVRNKILLKGMKG